MKVVKNENVEFDFGALIPVDGNAFYLFFRKTSMLPNRLKDPCFGSETLRVMVSRQALRAMGKKMIELAGPGED